MHRLAATVDMAIEKHLAKDSQLSRLVFWLKCDVGGFPIAPNSVPEKYQMAVYCVNV